MSNYLTDLKTLFGPDAAISNVEEIEDYVHFSLDGSVPFESPMGVTVTILQSVEGLLECMIRTEHLTEFLRFAAAMPRLIDLLKQENTATA